MRVEERHDVTAHYIIIMVVSVRRIRWAGRAAGMGEMRNAYRIMVGKPERTRPN